MQTGAPPGRELLIWFDGILAIEDEHLMPYLPNPRLHVAQRTDGWALLRHVDAKEIIASNTMPLG